MIWYSVVFSLNDSKTYVYMLMMLVASMVRTKSLQEKDTYYVICDEEVASFIKNIPLLTKNVTLIEKPRPKSLLEGCSWRYQLHKHVDVFDKTCCYLDVDMLCIKTTHIAELQENQMIVYAEGKSDDSNFCGDMVLKSQLGFTSGFFAYRIGFDVLSVLEEISHKIEQNIDKKPYYTLDQPYFNKALEDKNILLLFPEHVVSFNGHNNLPQAHLINFCGEPGNGDFHFMKMLQMVL